MKRRVEAGDCRHAWERSGDGIERGDRLGLMQWRKFDERAQGGLHVGVDDDRLAKSLPTMDYSMPNDIRVAKAAVKRGSQLARVDRRVRRR
jgi:hypothetical protein